MKLRLLSLLSAAALLVPSLSAEDIAIGQNRKAPREKFVKTTLEPAKLAGTYVGIGYASAQMLVKRTLQLSVKGEWVSGSMLDARPGQFVRDGVKSTFASSDVTTDDKNEGTYLNFGPAKAEYVTFDDEGTKKEGILVEGCFLERQVKAAAPAKKK